MSKAKRKYEHKRIWLDPKNPESLAWACRTEENYSDPGQQSIQIADCNRSIRLELSSASDARKITRLVGLLCDALTLYRKHN